MKAYKHYNMLLELGDLLEMYPELTGVWTEDKKEFEEIYESTLNINITFEDGE